MAGVTRAADGAFARTTERGASEKFLVRILGVEPPIDGVSSPPLGGVQRRSCGSGNPPWMACRADPSQLRVPGRAAWWVTADAACRSHGR